MKRIIIVGAGASGVYLSILLKKNINDICVTVLEQNQTSLKKLLATGNGRCNLSNKNISIQSYFSDRLDIVESIIHDFSMPLQMNEIGLYTLYHNHLLYPKSEQASSVKDVFMNEAKRYGVQFLYEQQVYQIEKKDTYHIYTNQDIFQADFVILAMGSEAGKLSGTYPQRYDILKKLNLKVLPSRPSLVQMNTKPALKELKGVRIKGTFRLLKGKECVHQEKGELLFTDYGVSGIAIMQLSAYMEPNTQYKLNIDFFDELDEKQLREYIELRQRKGYNHFYDGLLNHKLSVYFEKKNVHDVQKMIMLLKRFELEITGLRSYETAQVMKGGLSLEEVNDLLEIKKYPHMYAMGEILNVDGLCGGYNLHFALSSAYRVFQAIERELYVKNK